MKGFRKGTLFLFEKTSNQSVLRLLYLPDSGMGRTTHQDPHLDLILQPGLKIVCSALPIGQTKDSIMVCPAK